MSRDIDESIQDRLVARRPPQTTRATDTCYSTLSPHLSRSSSYSWHSPDHSYNALYTPLAMCTPYHAQRPAQHAQCHGCYHQCTALNVTLHAPLPPLPLASPVSLLPHPQKLVIIRTPHMHALSRYHRRILAASSLVYAFADTSSLGHVALITSIHASLAHTRWPDTHSQYCKSRSRLSSICLVEVKAVQPGCPSLATGSRQPSTSMFRPAGRRSFVASHRHRHLSFRVLIIVLLHLFFDILATVSA